MILKNDIMQIDARTNAEYDTIRSKDRCINAHGIACIEFCFVVCFRLQYSQSLSLFVCCGQCDCCCCEWWLIDMCIINAYSLYQQKQQVQISPLEFRQE